MAHGRSARRHIARGASRLRRGAAGGEREHEEKSDAHRAKLASRGGARGDDGHKAAAPRRWPFGGAY